MAVANTESLKWVKQMMKKKSLGSFIAFVQQLSKQEMKQCNFNSMTDWILL